MSYVRKAITITIEQAKFLAIHKELNLSGIVQNELNRIIKKYDLGAE